MPENQSTPNVAIEESWKQALLPEFSKPYFSQLRAFLKQEKASGATVYPPGKLIFNAFDSTPFDAVKVVILGQDPYHGPGQAHGLSFSVPPEQRIPPSLRNIYKELESDLGITAPNHGNLQSWASQGVLLLNSMLTVQASQPGSHQKKGWEEFTTATIQAVSDQRTGVVFMLWGKYAQVKGEIIDSQKHLVLQSAHPSPFSAHRGFLGNRHFSLTNQYLTEQGKDPINWQV